VAALGGHQWHTSVILATQEAKIRRIKVQSQPRQIVHEPYLEKNQHKNRAGRMAHVIEHLPSKNDALISKPQYL
jgi:hypothetical protein